jgi:hypothetical protein
MEINMKIMNNDTLSIAKSYTAELTTKLIGKAISAGAKIRSVDKQTLTKGISVTGALVAGFLVASKLLPLQLILGLLGGSVMLSDVLSRIEDAEERAKVEAAFNALKAAGDDVSIEAITNKVITK